MKGFLCGHCPCSAFVPKYLGNFEYFVKALLNLKQEPIYGSVCEYMRVNDACESVYIYSFDVLYKKQ